jgi:hypothetical protein
MTPLFTGQDSVGKRAVGLESLHPRFVLVCPPFSLASNPLSSRAYLEWLFWIAGLVAAFNQEVGITGAILTKLDGDSRGGAALSVKEVRRCLCCF